MTTIKVLIVIVNCLVWNNFKILEKHIRPKYLEVFS